jgi:ketosteroid isomerase-like protein
MLAMKKTVFASPQDVEAAFYDALERGDIDAMMEVWADDEEVVCIHPGGPRLVGYEAVLKSWAQIFASGQRLRFQISHHVVLSGMMLTVHSVQENIVVRGEPGQGAPVVASNAYLRTANGWRMIVHHASPAPAAVQESPRVPQASGPKVLH